MPHFWKLKIVKFQNFVSSNIKQGNHKDYRCNKTKIYKFPALCKVQTGFYETKYACPEHSVTVHTKDDSYQSHQSDLDQSKTKDTSFSTSNNHGSMNKRLFLVNSQFSPSVFLSFKSIQFWYYKFFVWKHFWLFIYPLRFAKVFFQGLSFKY